MFNTAGSGVVMWPAGAEMVSTKSAMMSRTPAHRSCVGGVHDGAILRLSKCLKALPEGDGTLLDQCSVMATTELSEGNTHTNDEFPVLLAGRGGGRLRTGLHVRDVDGNASLAGFTALRGAGIPIEHFGYESGRVGRGLDPILVG